MSGQTIKGSVKTFDQRNTNAYSIGGRKRKRKTRRRKTSKKRKRG